MKLITRNTDYAVRALCYIYRQNKEAVSVAELVAELDIPRPFLRKILQTLSSEGLLKSYKGQGGGFAQAKAAKEIFLTDLIRIFQNSIRLNECIFKKKICPNKSTCLLKAEIDGIEEEVLKKLGSITIASLIRDNSQHNDKKENNPCQSLRRARRPVLKGCR